MSLRKISKKICFFILFLLFFTAVKKECLGTENQFITIVNPVRGEEVWGGEKGEIFKNTIFQKNLVDEQGLKATWLLRSDAISSSDFVSIFKNSLFQGSEIGVFLEIMPQLSKEAQVIYPSGGTFWHDANKIFLSGYKPEDRIKLIDKTFENFKSVFGYYPKSAGAWHVDAFSANYMEKKYGITGVLICADQFATDNYQIWGGWWGVPYYPSQYNILTPAQTLENKLNVVIFWWAARESSSGYRESLHSVQVNDYLGHGLGAPYFNKLLAEYLFDQRNKFGEITVGLENDMDFTRFGQGYKEQLQQIKNLTQTKNVKTVTLNEFSQWYQNTFKTLSPDHYIGDWSMSKDLRVGFENINNQRIIRDLRIYNENWPETNLLSANPWESFSLNNPYRIDTLRFESQGKIISSDKDAELIIKNFGKQKIPFKISNYIFFAYCLLVICLLAIFLKKNIFLLFLIVIGSVSLSLVMIKSGLVYSFGMGFWGPNGHDGIWHLSLINQLANFSLNHPVFSGSILTNYHFGFDILSAILSRTTGILPVNLYFQVLPPLFAVLLGILCYSFVNKWTGSKKSALWSTFFVYFGGSFGWLVNFVRNRNFGGESMFWANQSVSSLINPPYALSIIILLTGLIKLLDYFKNPKKKNLIICSLLFGILIQVKVYIGIIVLLSLACMLLFALLFRRNKIKENLRLFLGALLVALIVFLPFNLKASSLLVFDPLWFPRTMLAYSDRFGWIKLENARIAYYHSGKWIKWILAEGLALLIFIFGNIGTRAVGLFYGGYIWKKKQKISEIEVLLYSVLAFSLIIPLLFIQKGNPWNTIQFFYYFQFILGIIAGATMGNFKYPYIFALIIVFLTIPTTIDTLKNNYLPWRPPSRISVEELEALNFLKAKESGIVLTFPYNEKWKEIFSEPRPLYAYETTAYVSALSGKTSFLEDEMNLTISGYDWQSRKDESQRFFLTNDRLWAIDFLKANNIKYLYLVKGQKINLGQTDINAKLVFENGEVRIFQIN